MKPRRFPAVLALSAALALAGCAPYASVSLVRPAYHPNRPAVGAFAPVERQITKALRQQKREPLGAIGGFLAAARTAQRQLAHDPADIAAREDYNFAVARVIGTIEQASLDPWSQPLRVPSTDGDFVLAHKRRADPQYDPSLYELIPADQLRIGGAYVRDHKLKAGIGAPCVAVELGADNHPRDRFMMPKLYHGVTALIHFEGHHAVIAFEDPLLTERVTLAGQRFPLAADFTAPAALMLSEQNPRKLGLSNLLHPGRFAESARVTRTQPYDPDKTVVLVIHGLMNTPAAWVPMFNHLIADEQIRRNYQLWFYSYPTGYPYPYSAANLRRELDAIERRFPLRKKMVVIGHSMGGCIARLLITDTGEKVWREILDTPPAETAMPPESKALLSEALIFRHRPEIGRVVLIAAPLRGSELAGNWIGRTASALVRLPAAMKRVGHDVLQTLAFQGSKLRLPGAPTSVDILAPDDPFARAIQSIPVAPGIPHHVICGDRGRGGNKDGTEPVMTDGVVPYWSSHMETAESEFIAPCGHGVHRNPEAIAEVLRILKEHARHR